jgi:hypothetical protein
VLPGGPSEFPSAIAEPTGNPAITAVSVPSKSRRLTLAPLS